MNIDIMSMMIGQKAGVGAGGKGLPAVTSADNGKHLEVVNGKWKVKNPNSTIVALWEETQQAFTPNPQFGNLPCAAFLPSAAITTGETYYVLWEGTEYACVGVDMNLGALTGVALGNGGLLGLSGDTGEPFLIGYNPSDGTCAIVTATEGAYKFGVYAEVVGGSGGGSTWYELTEMDEGVTVESPWVDGNIYLLMRTNGEIVTMNLMVSLIAQQRMSVGTNAKIVIANTHPAFPSLYKILSNGRAYMTQPCMVTTNGYKISTWHQAATEKITIYIGPREDVNLTGTNYIGAAGISRAF